MTQCELRKKVADVIRTKGFSKGMLQNSRGECCILGALLIAKNIKITNFLHDLFREDNDLGQVLLEMNFRNYKEAYKFNDDVNVTKEDVIERLEKGCL